MPPVTEEEYAALKASIAEHGVLVHVVEDTEGNIIDGYHRRQAWEELRAAGYDLPDYQREGAAKSVPKPPLFGTVPAGAEDGRFNGLLCVPKLTPKTKCQNQDSPVSFETLTKSTYRTRRPTWSGPPPNFVREVARLASSGRRALVQGLGSPLIFRLIAAWLIAACKGLSELAVFGNSILLVLLP